MKHIDQQTLELYVLNAQEAGDLKPEIELHVAECLGCKLLFEEISAFHAELSAELKAAAVEAPVTEHRLARRKSALEPFGEPFGATVSYVPRSAMEKVRHLIMKHPVATGAGTFASLAILALGGVFLMRHDTRNPSYVRYNDSAGRFEVDNDQNEMLWSIPLNEAKGHQDAEQASGMKQAEVIDLDADGINEVVTALKFPGNETYTRPALRIFDNSGNVLKQFDERRYAAFNGTTYENALVVTEHFVVDRDAKEFYLVMTNGRSPTVVRRIGRDGTELGEYWHFGQTGALYFSDVDGDGRRELVLCGINDVDDAKELSKPVFTILDPQKIVGRKEATCTRGFGLPPSDAELYYIRLPFTDINFADNVNASVIWMREHDATFEFEMCSQVELVNRALDFSFSRDMRCLGVKATTWTLQRMKVLYESGKAKSLFTPAYEEELVEGVAYWDGSRWSDAKSQVIHPLP